MAPSDWSLAIHGCLVLGCLLELTSTFSIPNTAVSDVSLCRYGSDSLWSSVSWLGALKPKSVSIAKLPTIQRLPICQTTRSRFSSGSSAAWPGTCSRQKGVILWATEDPYGEVKFPQVLKRVFMSIDTEQVGFLNTDELLDAVDTLCLGIHFLDAHKARHFFLTVDGTMTYDEFVKALHGVAELFSLDVLEMAVVLEDAVLSKDVEYVASVYQIFIESKKSEYKGMERVTRLGSEEE